MGYDSCFAGPDTSLPYSLILAVMDDDQVDSFLLPGWNCCHQEAVEKLEEEGHSVAKLDDMRQVRRRCWPGCHTTDIWLKPTHRRNY